MAKARSAPDSSVVENRTPFRHQSRELKPSFRPYWPAPISSVFQRHYPLVSLETKSFVNQCSLIPDLSGRSNPAGFGWLDSGTAFSFGFSSGISIESPG